ncbi:di-heme oxidoredictase family protein [Aurantimonas sp. A3-2-R12]|uniref:di-heme oxidoredictase family protein n=1 Tax=Aurantimonas sp. A3-2-R12 TaxID=3114362 RepID=UPI002E19197C|nr:di-heme oxidoredictase family protein [Aurantimonas sp. A3-2-R12]
MRSTLLALGLSIALALPAFAGEPAWRETAIKQRIDPASLAGPLSAKALRDLVQKGRDLFEARFTILDGAGRPNATQAIVPTTSRRPAEQAFQRLAGPDANACASCHNEPVTGGAGGFVTNVFVSEGFESADFDTLDPQFSNERGTNHLFGAGLVELLAREMTADLVAARAEALQQARASGEPVRMDLASKGVAFGRITALPDGSVDLAELDGVDADLVVRPFTQKGVMTSLRQFTVNALNHHHGMQPDERWGARWTGSADFDGDGVADEIGTGEVSALVAFQASLPPPRETAPNDPAWRKAAAIGRQRFADLGCETCHRPTLPLESLAFADPGPVDMAGTLRQGDVASPAVYDLALLDWAKTLPRNDKGEIQVPLFGDLKRHRIADTRTAALGNETLAQRFVERDVFMTAELWGIADTGPYGHRGDMTTLDNVIRAHGGEAADSAKAYRDLPEAERSALIAWLKTLRIEP